MNRTGEAVTAVFYYESRIGTNRFISAVNVLFVCLADFFFLCSLLQMPFITCKKINHYH